jgi:hypothetical protein
MLKKWNENKIKIEMIDEWNEFKLKKEGGWNSQ